MTNETFWALKRREAANREAKNSRRTRYVRGIRTISRKAVPADVAEVVQPTPEAAPEPSYRDLQAQAKELDIPANQTKDELAAAIEEAQAEE